MSRGLLFVLLFFGWLANAQNVPIGVLDPNINKDKLLTAYRYLKEAPEYPLEKMELDSKVAQGYYNSLSEDQKKLVLTNLNESFYNSFFLNEEFYKELRNKLIQANTPEHSYDFVSLPYNPVDKADRAQKKGAIEKIAAEWKSSANLDNTLQKFDTQDMVVGKDNRLGGVYIPSLELLGKINVDANGFTDVLDDGSRYFIFHRNKELPKVKDRIIVEVAIDKKLTDAKAVADKILTQWKNGAKGETLVKEYSANKTFLPSKGKMVVDRFNSSPLAQFVYDNLKQPGDIGIYESSIGYHVIKFDKEIEYQGNEEEVRDVETIKSTYGKEVDAYRLKQLLTDKYGSDAVANAYKTFQSQKKYTFPGTQISISQPEFDKVKKEVLEKTDIAAKNLDDAYVFEILFYKGWYDVLKTDIRPYIKDIAIYGNVLPIKFLSENFDNITAAAFNDNEVRKEIYKKFPAYFTEPADDELEMLIIVDNSREEAVKKFLDNGFTFDKIGRVYEDEGQTVQVMYLNGLKNNLKNYLGDNCVPTEEPKTCIVNGKTIWVKKTKHLESKLHTFEEINMDDFERYLQAERIKIAKNIR